MTDRPPLPYAFAEVRQRLQSRIFDLLPALGIHERPRGGLVTPLNPTRGDRHPGSFVIWTGGEAPGAWREFAGSAADKGDVLDLILYLRGLAGRIDAYWWALDFLGLGRGEVRPAGEAEAARRRAERDRLAAAAKEAARDEEKSAALQRWWLTLAPIAGTVAETYLREARGIDLSRLAHLPGALRFSPSEDHFDSATGEVTRWPCMVAAMTRGRRAVAALHRTWLAPDGSAKAPVTPAKKMAGPARGTAIRLSFGSSGRRPNEAAARGELTPLAIGEGIETSLTVACARPDLRVWAAGSLSGMLTLDWPACASAVVLLGENDASEGARKAFAAVEASWRKAANGRPLHVAKSAVGSDFNDWVRVDA